MQLETIVSRVLKEAGVPANLKGYAYLKDAIMMACQDASILKYITGRLYPGIAAKHADTASRVERAIRHAVEYACDNTDPDMYRKFFGNVGNIRTGKLNNSQFIAGMVEYIKMEESV